MLKWRFNRYIRFFLKKSTFYKKAAEIYSLRIVECV